MAGFLVLKAVKAGIPIAVSRGAPIASGIEAAKNGGLTLVCFARGKKMNVYTHGERIL
jgi:FdhD protein